MAVTQTSDLHALEQLGGTVTDILFQQVPLLAIPDLVANVDGKLADAGGEKITFTRWDTDISNVTQDAVRNSRTGVTPSKLSLASYSEDALTKTISFDGDSFAMDDSSSDAVEAISLIVAMEFGRYIQSHLISQAIDATNGTNLSLDVTGTSATMTVDGLLDARLKWGEHAGGLYPVAFMHTAQFNALAKTEDYKQLASGAGSALARQSNDWSRFIVATVHGMPIVLCDTLPSVAAAGEVPAKYTALLIAQEAFGVYVSDSPRTNVIMHAGSTVKTIDTHWRWASTFYRHNPRRVVKLITI